MIFIFGFSPRIKTIGPVDERTCARCNNKRFWLLKSKANWFSLFFIPIIPFYKKHFIECPICGESEDVSAEQFTTLSKKAALNNQAIDGSISAEAYDEKYKAY